VKIQLAFVRGDDKWLLGALVDGVPHGANLVSYEPTKEEVIEGYCVDFPQATVEEITVEEHNRLKAEWYQNYLRSKGR
jgi:hypothetical protein